MGLSDDWTLPTLNSFNGKFSIVFFKQSRYFTRVCTRGIQKVLWQILKKTREYVNQIESCKYI